MPKCGQMRVGAAWVGGKEPDLRPNGTLRPYDRRCRTRIMIGAQVHGQIGKNSIWRVQGGDGNYGRKKGTTTQYHYKYFGNPAYPGSVLEQWQLVFKQVMAEVKLLPENVRDHYRAMRDEYLAKYRSHPGMYKAREWPHFYVQERLKELYPGYP